MLHAGTNDVQTSRTNEILDNYRRGIRRFKQKSSHIIISGILPRINAFTGFHRKASDINNRLKSLCHDEEVAFTNAWDNFYDSPNLFRPDALPRGWLRQAWPVTTCGGDLVLKKLQTQGGRQRDVSGPMEAPAQPAPRPPTEPTPRNAEAKRDISVLHTNARSLLPIRD